MQWTFQGIKDFIKNRLGLLTDWVSTLFYGTNERLIDAFSFTQEKSAFYNEYLLRENKWDLAQNRTSLLYNCGYLAYKPHRKIGAQGFVEISTNSSYAAPYTEVFTIPEWSTFTIDGKNVFVTANTNYTVGIFSKFLDVSQGDPTEIRFTAQGLMNETYTISDDSVDDAYVKVYLILDEPNSIYQEIEIVDSLYKVTDASTLYCQLDNDYDYTTVTVKFGNNINGKALAAGQRIRIMYAKTAGESGNIFVTGNATINFTIVNSLLANISLYARISNYIDGGSEIETTDEIRVNAPNLFQTGYRAGSKTDWETLLERTTVIDKVYCYGEYELRKDILADKTIAQAIFDGELTSSGRVPNVDNVAFITALDSSGAVLSDAEKEDIVTNYLHGVSGEYDAKINLTTFVSWVDPEIISLRLIVNAMIDLDKEVSDMESSIKTDIEALYGITQRSFFQHVYASILSEDISNVDGVYKHNSEVYVRDLNFRNVEATAKSLVIPKIEDETLHIRVTRKVSGTWELPYEAAVDLPEQDELTGALVELNHFSIKVSSITYETGLLSFEFRGDGLSRVTNGDFTDGTDSWDWDTTVEPTWIIPSTINSAEELLQKSTDVTLGNDAAADTTCLEILGNSEVLAPAKANNYVYQSVTLVNGDYYLLEALIYTPSENTEPYGNAGRIAIGTSAGDDSNAFYIFNNQAYQLVMFTDFPHTTSDIVVGAVAGTYYFKIKVDNLNETLITVTLTGNVSGDVLYSELVTEINNGLVAAGISATEAVCFLDTDPDSGLPNTNPLFAPNQKTGCLIFRTATKGSAGNIEVWEDAGILTADKLFANFTNFDYFARTNKAMNEDEWNRVTLPFKAGSTNFISLFLYSDFTSDKAYYDKIIIKNIDAGSLTSWGVQDPGTSDDDGYILEVYYQTEANKDIILQLRNQITDLDQDNIEVESEYQTS
jgi:hypothetical protein